jgi:hypothetical protein
MWPVVVGLGDGATVQNLMEYQGRWHAAFDSYFDWVASAFRRKRWREFAEISQPTAK